MVPLGLPSCSGSTLPLYILLQHLKVMRLTPKYSAACPYADIDSHPGAYAHASADRGAHPDSHPGAYGDG